MENEGYFLFSWSNIYLFYIVDNIDRLILIPFQGKHKPKHPGAYSLSA